VCEKNLLKSFQLSEQITEKSETQVQQQEAAADDLELRGYKMTPDKFYHNQPPLPWQRNLGQNRL